MIQFEEFMNENIVKYLDMKMKLTGSVSHSEMCLDLLLGKIDAVALTVAKGVFEPPNMYLLVKELGGVGTDIKGNDLGNKEWKPVGMNVNAAIFASSQISNELIRLLKSS